MSLAIALYKPAEGQTDELMLILHDHLPTLRRLGYATERPGVLARSSDGTVLEIFEWASDGAKAAAHQHPDIRALWARMMPICTFPSLSELPEAEKPFPNFTLV